MSSPDRMLLEVTDLALDRGGRALFSGVSFALPAGEGLVLRGPNGSGKTSLLRILAGLTVADHGALCWLGETRRFGSAAQRASALYVGHANALKDELTAEENLLDALALDGVVATADEINAALGRVGLSHRRRVEARRLSQGQKRRIGLARLSLTAKPLWLLDEPTNALDTAGIAIFAELVDAHLGRGGAACIATHVPLSIRAPLREYIVGQS